MDREDRRGPAVGDDAAAFEWEPLPTAHAAPRLAPAPYLGPAPDAETALEATWLGGGERTKRERAADKASRRHRLHEAERRTTLVNALTLAFGVLGILVFLYPGRLEPDAFLPALNPYFQARPFLFPYILGSPRWLLVIAFLVAASGFYYGRSWSTAVGILALTVLCIAFYLHPVALVISAAILPLVWLFRQSFRRAHV